MVAAMLRRDGHEVLEAASGKEALEICEREDVDLVFLDLGLPDIDGFEVLANLKDRGSEVPVVVLTASAVPATKERAARAGAVMTLRKPASGDELRGVLAKTVGLAAPRPRGSDELDQLKIEARGEIAAMAREIVDHAPAMDRTAIRIKAHRLAGLAAQFAATEIAESADQLEAAASDGGDLLPALTAVSVALFKYQAEQKA
jgi:two-component system response regulator TctD